MNRTDTAAWAALSGARSPETQPPGGPADAAAPPAPGPQQAPGSAAEAPAPGRARPGGDAAPAGPRRADADQHLLPYGRPAADPLRPHRRGAPGSAAHRAAPPPRLDGHARLGLVPEVAGADAVEEHCRALGDALERFRESGLGLVCAWGTELARRLSAGSRLLVAGNGGSAAQAQHLTAELVGRYRGERPAYSALALHADTSTVTAVGNDYGFEQLYARQVTAHGRPGDVLLLMSTSGRSANLLAAADAARAARLRVWAMTGPCPNPLAARAEETLAVDAASTATVQEMHLVALHLLCEAFDEAREEAA